MLPPAPEPPRSATEAPAVALSRIGTFSRPVLVTAPPGDGRQLVVVEQEGAVRLVVDGSVRRKPFLDLREHVRAGPEDGLLGLVFAPDYATSGLLYALFTDLGGNLRLVEFRRSAFDPEWADPVTARSVLIVDKRTPMHNGGMLQFGPDGLLYVGIGDGGEPARAQDPESPLGKILRLDPRANAPPEVFASGLRNPWRFWIDAATGDTYIGDVGEGRREELDVVPSGESGLDFGWPCFEGSIRLEAEGTCADPRPPVFEYEHGRRRCAIIGGVVVHDRRLPRLDGIGLFADACGAAVRTLLLDGRASALAGTLGVKVTNPVSFGTDGSGRVYVTSFLGPVYRLDPASS
jgi:glucose/arabinose dehydrogenase